MSRWSDNLEVKRKIPLRRAWAMPQQAQTGGQAGDRVGTVLAARALPGPAVMPETVGKAGLTILFYDDKAV